MKWPELKEILLRDVAITSLSTLFRASKLLIITVSALTEKIRDEDKKYFENLKCLKVKTRSHHVRIFLDSSHLSPLIVIKPRGLFQMWNGLDVKAIPDFVAKEICDESCSDEKRARLIGQVIGLKAFW